MRPTGFEEIYGQSCAYDNLTDELINQPYRAGTPAGRFANQC